MVQRHWAGGVVDEVRPVILLSPIHDDDVKKEVVMRRRVRCPKIMSNEVELESFSCGDLTSCHLATPRTTPTRYHFVTPNDHSQTPTRRQAHDRAIASSRHCHLLKRPLSTMTPDAGPRSRPSKQEHPRCFVMMMTCCCCCWSTSTMMR